MARETDGHDQVTAPSGRPVATHTRAQASYTPHTDYVLAKGEQKHYQQQFSDIYFLRLAQLKPAVEELAAHAWDGYQIAGDTVHRVERVLDVRQGQLCWVTGTIYMDMPLKPNILDDISKDHWIAAPPPREKYVSPDGLDKIMLEDESGRLRLTGPFLQSELLVTGCIVAVMGTENANGDFEVIDSKIPDLPKHPPTSSDSHASASKGQKIAIVSGLNITGTSDNSLATDMLMEWLLGESASAELQASAAQITRLIIAGDSLAEANPLAMRDDHLPNATTGKKASHKKYGYDSASYDPAPIFQLDLLLSTLLPSIPITLLPGASDPANVSLPQQPLHAALFPRSRAYAAAASAANPTVSTSAKAAQQNVRVDDAGTFHPATNPSLFSINDYLFLGSGGQTIDDISKYISDFTPLELMEYTLRWRLVAPTAPDTLWCYPYQSADPFVLRDGRCPHVYFVGNQTHFATTIVSGHDGQKVRCISVPKFSETGEVILLDLESLETEIVRFNVFEQPI